MPFPKVRSHELASTTLGRDLTSPELRAGRARRVMTAAPNSSSDEQMFGAKQQVPQGTKCKIAVDYALAQR
jgi:hypothetical protein